MAEKLVVNYFFKCHIPIPVMVVFGNNPLRGVHTFHAGGAGGARGAHSKG